MIDDIINHPKFDALLNVVVFSPIAFYIARGEKPPQWLMIASLAYTGVIFFRDLNMLIGDMPATPVAGIQPPIPKGTPPRLPSPAASGRFPVP